MGLLTPEVETAGDGRSPARLAAARRARSGSLVVCLGPARRPAALAGLTGTVILSALLASATSIVLGQTRADALAKTGDAHAVLDRIRQVTHVVAPSVRGIGGAQVGGQAAENVDFIDAVYGNFPLMVGLIALLTFVLRTRAFRSLLLPLKAVVLNVLSVGAAFGVMVLIWQNGYGSQAIWGIKSTGAIDAWLPIMVFAFLFGLSMDYEVFILSRMREEYDATGSTRDAVIRGIGRTGRLVTSGALILFFAFMALADAPNTTVKVIATGLAAGILLDATVVRMLLVPALVALFGRWNWWLPSSMRRLLRAASPSPQRRLEHAEI